MLAPPPLPSRKRWPPPAGVAAGVTAAALTRPAGSARGARRPLLSSMRRLRRFVAARRGSATPSRGMRPRAEPPRIRHRRAFSWPRATAVAPPGGREGEAERAARRGGAAPGGRESGRWRKGGRRECRLPSAGWAAGTGRREWDLGSGIGTAGRLGFLRCWADALMGLSS